MKKADCSSQSKEGFSLVEMSIVLVIMGLLVGGILAGQNLVKAAELRAVSNEFGSYSTAINLFKEKYNALPGDLANAESYWGQLAVANAACQDGAATATATCSGDGDGNVEVTSTRSREIFRIWQHLANAGLIEGQYSGTKNGASNWGSLVKTNNPASKYGTAGWSIVAKPDIAVWTGWYLNMFQPSNSNHWLQIGNGPEISNWAAFKPEDAWNIDSKMDDGMPGQGNITTYNPSSYNVNCASSTTAATATYMVSQTGIYCTLHMGI